ncbi:MAG TPA: hypothetical protein VFY15_01190, partial [Acidimicrobiia bacterium]|nr:hypothetical protein [Acidimicrobiia bacterium]
MSDRGIPHQIDVLGDRISSGDLTGAGTTLDQLRRHWRRLPEDFAAGDLDALRRLAAELLNARVSSLDGLLESVFGFDSFRPG